jgi:AcrR family transcriptional regulator
MARPKSEDKRKAILTAATQVFAERGLGHSPTSEISRRAGVAEGTLFTYFKTKDELVCALYQELKQQMAGAMMLEFQRQTSVRDSLRLIWDGYVNWGVHHPEQRKVLAQLQVSNTVTPEARAAGAAPFSEIEALARDAVESEIVRDDFSLEFVATMLTALAEATMEMMSRNPPLADLHRTNGFEMFWGGISRK